VLAAEPKEEAKTLIIFGAAPTPKAEKDKK
jgi:hypothetical protein